MRNRITQTRKVKDRELQRLAKQSACALGCFEGLGDGIMSRHAEAFKRRDRQITLEMLREAGLLTAYRSHRI